jgi:hypothetical protein
MTTYTADKKQLQRFYESEMGNIATLTGTGKDVTALTLQTALYPYIYIQVAATTKDATLDIDASIDGTTFPIVIQHAHAVVAGSPHLEAITNIGYRAIQVTINQTATSTPVTDIFYVMK